MDYFGSAPWHQHDKVIPYRPGPNAAATIFEEHAPCRDEATVQSRFIQNVSQDMNAICEEADVDKVMGDYKSCANNPVTGVPDVANELKTVGEMKASWIFEHILLLNKAYKTSNQKALLGLWSLKTFAKIQQVNINFRPNRKVHERSGNEIRLPVHVSRDRTRDSLSSFNQVLMKANQAYLSVMSLNTTRKVNPTIQLRNSVSGTS